MLKPGMNFVFLFTILQNPLGSISIPIPTDNDNFNMDVNPCDPLHPPSGTAILCFPPGANVRPTDCSQTSIPGTIASYTCRDFKGAVYQGFINCAPSGIWIISFEHANNSLCNIDGPIVNLQIPDIMVARGIPEFTTPVPNTDLMQPDFPLLTDYEKVALQLHNTFRRNHNVPLVEMSKQLNLLAQDLVESFAFGNDLEDMNPHLKWNPLNRTMSIEMNWYFQVPPSSDKVEAVSNAVQMWYSGFLQYDWEDVVSKLDVQDALAFTRVVWKATKLIGIGVANTRNVTFVACLYTPGRNIESTDPVQQFVVNVPRVRIG